MADVVEGVIENIIYFNEDTGYSVLSLHPSKYYPNADGDEVIVVGKLVELHPGESVRFSGDWTAHKEYGIQFKASTFELLMNTTDDIKRFLSSGVIKGINVNVASQIIKHFGLAALDTLDDNPDRIHEVPGLKPAKADQIAKSWAATRRSRKVLTYLTGYGITPPMAQKIFDYYADDTITQVEADPYQLALDIDGFNFKQADILANALGMAADADARVRGVILYALQQLAREEGHVYAPRGLVVDKAAELINVEREQCDQAVTNLLRKRLLVKKVRPLNTRGTTEALYLPEVYEQEDTCARTLIEMQREPLSRLKKTDQLDWKAFFAKLKKKGGPALTDQQEAAVHAALTHKVSVLTGGPGTGKTTTLRAVIEALHLIKASYLLASPTGRAAKRLSEATGQPASTIHRLLGYDVEGNFFFCAENPLDADMIVIDETSMIDLDLFSHLLEAVPAGAHLLLVGDVDQLPSVGAGDVLNDIIISGAAYVTRLDAIFRQQEDSLIIVNAHRVNHGEMPDLSNTSPDFFFFSTNENNLSAAADMLVDIVRNRIPTKFGYDSLNAVQVLAPMYRGDLGINVLNERLQTALNPQPDGQIFTLGARTYRLGDKVIQTRNDYAKEVYNGDIGRVIGFSPEEQLMTVNMDGRVVEYAAKDTTDLWLAYAISIHRSQGGEYPVVVVPVVSQYFRMLRRNLLYTAITRARELVILVGSRRAIQMAVENDQVLRRYSGLGWLIKHQKEL